MSHPQDKYSVFWYNQKEISDWSEEDFAVKAAEFAAAGVNIVMTFSCTHFRWSFRPWWPEINAAIAKLVRACHRYGIRVVEHHSSHLTFNPRNAAEWQSVSDDLRARNSSLACFSGLREYIASGDPEIAPGVHLSDCRQIDGRTGEYARTTYWGYGHCFNHPVFRKAYFEYLASVYATGVDGIMTDDVQYFGNGNACACPICRKLFREKTGFELPKPQDWGHFYGDYQNPVFVAWLRFRIDSTADFQRAVSHHAESLGLKLLRPNYATSTFQRNITAYPFEAAGELWSCVFQENMFSSVMRASWPSWTGDAIHRSAMARKYAVAPMSMFYPERYDDYYFCWALSRLWGHLLMATPEGGDLNEIEQKFYRFEQHHPRLAVAAYPLAEMAFLQPRASLDFATDPVESSARPLHVWIQGSIFQNLRPAILFEDDSLEQWRKYPLIVVAGATMLSDEQLERMKRYCQSGGRLLIFGAFGIFHPDGSLREHPERTFGFSAELSDFTEVGPGTFTWNGQTVALPAVKESRVLSDVRSDASLQVVAQSKEGDVFGVAALDGHLIWLAGGVRSRHPEAEHYNFGINRYSEPDKKAVAPDYAADELKAVPGAILKTLLGHRPTITCSNSDYQLSVLASRDNRSVTVFMVNVAGTLAKPPEKISHKDLFQNFLPQAAPNRASFSVTLQLPDHMDVPREVTACSPEFDGEKLLAVQSVGRTLNIVIPPETFAGYLELQFGQ